MSTHRVEVIRIQEIEPHPNADSLGLVRIEGFTAIVRLGDFKPGDLAAYIEPDYVVPDTEQFAFLQGHRRIKAKRLRQVWSQGLLIHAPDGAKEGDCVMERLGIVRYEPPMVGCGLRGSNVDAESPHRTLAWLTKYDLENWRKYRSALDPGEQVTISEKLHGASSRFAWRDERMWVGSRTTWWKRPEEDSVSNAWWRALDTHPWIEDWCRTNQELVLYGEIFGWVQDLRYGAKPGEIFFRAFDVMLPDGRWMDACDFSAALPAEHRVPVLYVGAYCPENTEELSRLKRSKLADHIAEGVVIRPLRERVHPGLGRVALKLVSDLYLERS